MGGGTYSCSVRSSRADTRGYATKSAGEIFSQRNVNKAMDPHGVTVREACDSKEHPNTTPIIIALDVTGSMGSIPHSLIKNGLPTLMQRLMDSGVPDPEVLFLAIGDHECDECPLQVGQFESSDELLDSWLTKVYLEAGGGGNAGESYHLAWMFAAFHTRIDSFDKRGKKGYLFTIGDEPCLSTLTRENVKQIMGSCVSEKKVLTSHELFEAASEKYNVYHLHMKQGHNGLNPRVIDGWKQNIGNHLILVDSNDELPAAIANAVIKPVVKQSHKEEEVL